MSWRFMRTLVAAVALGVTWSAPSKADTQHQVAVTFSPLHLVSPIVELTGEFRLHDKFSVADMAAALSREATIRETAGRAHPRARGPALFPASPCG